MSEIELAIKSTISEAFKILFDAELPVDDISLQPTKKEFEGSFTFVIFPYLKVIKQKPEEAGTKIGVFIKENSDLVTDFNVVKGFLNLSLSASTWKKELNTIFEHSAYGKLPSNGKKVMVEFSSPNTNKPLHLGHLRNNFLGDSVSRILDQAGYEVMKVNLVNDRGIHICKSMLAYQKFGNNESPTSSGIKGDHLIGKYYVKFDQEYKAELASLKEKGLSDEEAVKQSALMQEAQDLLKRWEEGDSEAVALWELMNGWVYEGFDATYATMGISFDKIYKESDTYLLGKDIVTEGLASGVFYKKEDGSVWVDLTGEGLDEKLVLRGDGTAVYMTQDMGTCDHKYQDFPFDQSVYTVGNEQDYHFNVLFKIMAKLGRSYAQGLHHLSYGMVDLPTGKMKSREGTVVDADDLMEEMFETAAKQTEELGKIDSLSSDDIQTLFRILGLGALKYFLLKVDPKKRMLFNPAESIEFQGNTGPFIQYTHARISAILRRATAEGISINGLDLDGPLHAKEREIISLLTQFPKTVNGAAKDYSPSLIAQYAYDVAKAYNGFYQELSIFGDDDEKQRSQRLMVSVCAAKVIKLAMGLLGIMVPERM